jgi:toxin HigB-1
MVFRRVVAWPKQNVYACPVIRSVANKETELLLAKGRSRRLPPDILRRAQMRLNQLSLAVTLEDLRFPPSNHLEALQGSRAGQWSIRINDQWRLCFRFVDGDAFDVEITDYH